jgi:hypothetical protein
LSSVEVTGVMALETLAVVERTEEAYEQALGQAPE